jgi:acetyltransferase-like isoleucine patch superfamily enzyme
MAKASSSYRTRFGLGSLKYILARIQKKLQISAVRGSYIHRTSAIEGGSQVVNSTMDRHSFCGYNCVILGADVGGFCSISDNVYIGGSAHPIEYVSSSPVFLSHRDSVKTKFALHDYHHMPRTQVGHDVWIGHGVHVRAGVTIGHGAVIGMGAVVTKDVPPYAIVVGNPAQIIRKRFADDICQRLLASKWWDYSDEILSKVAVDFTDPETFLRNRGLL